MFAAPLVAWGAAIGHVVMARRLKSGRSRQPIAREPRGWPELSVLLAELAAFGYAARQLHESRSPILEGRLAKVDLTILAQVEWTIVLGVWGSVAAAWSFAAVACCWTLRQRRTSLIRGATAESPKAAKAFAKFPSPHPILVALAVVVVGIGFVRLRVAIEAFLILPPHQRNADQLARHFDATTAALGRSIAECGLALLIASLGIVLSLLLPALRRRAISEHAFVWSAPSRLTTVVFALACAAGVASLVIGTEPLVAESDDPIPMTHMFANASLGFAPQTGVRGVGPDPLVEAPWLILGETSATVDGASAKDPTECATILRNKSMLYQQLSPGQPAPTALLVTVMPAVAAPRLFAYLAAARRSGRKTVTFVLSDTRTLERPVFGKLFGVRFTGLNAKLSESAEACGDDRGVAATASGRNVRAADLLEAWLAEPKRPCLVVAAS